VPADLDTDIPEALCLSALSGNCNGVNTILVAGWVKKRALSILVDSGSTHSFINELTVVETGYQSCYVQPIRVTVADGNYVYCNSRCPQFTWKMGSKTFVEDLRILKLGGCDVILGNDWMKKYNPTKFDHEKQCVTIGRKSNKVVLRAIPDKGQISMITGSTMSKLFSKGQTIMAYLFLIQATGTEVIEEVNSSIQGVLSHYTDVFAEPKSSPPTRSLDHTIPLKPGTSLVSLKPYSITTIKRKNWRNK